MKHIIWGNRNLDVDDWMDAYKEFLEINGIDDRSLAKSLDYPTKLKDFLNF